jgi:hypothetical protein
MTYGQGREMSVYKALTATAWRKSILCCPTDPMVAWNQRKNQREKAKVYSGSVRSMVCQHHLIHSMVQIQNKILGIKFRQNSSVS